MSSYHRYMGAQIGQSPEDYNAPVSPSELVSPSLPPGADPCDIDSDFYDEQLCEEIGPQPQDEGYPEEVEPPSEMAPYPQPQPISPAPSAPGAPGGGAPMGPLAAPQPSYPGAPGQEGFAPSGDPLLPGQAVDQDGYPAVDENGNPLDQNGNPIPPEGDLGDPCDPNNPNYDPSQCQDQQAQGGVCELLISGVPDNGKVKWENVGPYGTVGITNIIGPPGSFKTVYGIVSKNVFIQDPQSGQLYYLVIPDLSGIARNFADNNFIPRPTNSAQIAADEQKIRSICPGFMDFNDYLSAGYALNQPGFDASQLPLPGWSYQPTEDESYDDQSMQGDYEIIGDYLIVGAAIPQRSTPHQPHRSSRVYGRATAPRSKSAAKKRRLPPAGPGVRVPKGLKGYFVKGKATRIEAKRKAKSSAASKLTQRAALEARKKAFERKGGRSFARPQPLRQVTPVYQRSTPFPSRRTATSLRTSSTNIRRR